MLRIIAVLLLIPLLDALLLVAIAGSGVLPGLVVIALVVLTALLGMLLVRAEGRHTLRRIQERLARGEIPTDDVIDGGFLVAAGAFFLTPGFVTDIVGILLAVPVTRWPIRKVAKKYVITPYLDAKADGFATGNVYVGGFPNQNGRAGPGEPTGGSGRSSSSGSEFDTDSARDIDFEETDDE